MCEKADKKKDLQEIVEVASAIILQLGGNDDDANNRMEGENTCFSTDFSFTNNYCKTFMESIGSFKLSKTTVVALLEIFKQKSLQLKQHCEESFRNLTKRLSCTPGGINGDLSVNYVFQIWQNNLEEHTRKLKEMLILSIENKIRSFNKEVETVSDIESSDESSVAQKGHSPRAVAILEKVFSLTPNINRSEKHQLAKATKLEPRQVTIWVSIAFHARNFSCARDTFVHRLTVLFLSFLSSLSSKIDATGNQHHKSNLELGCKIKHLEYLGRENANRTKWLNLFHKHQSFVDECQNQARLRALNTIHPTQPQQEDVVVV